VELRQILSLMVVFALLGGALYAVRLGKFVPRVLTDAGRRLFRWSSLRLGHAPARTKSLATVERLTLTPQHSLHLVRIQGREVVVATHPHGCIVLNDGSIVSNDERTLLSRGELHGDHDESNRNGPALHALAEGSRL